MDELFSDDPPPPPRGETSYSVAQVGALIAGAVEQLFPNDLWVEGEISNLNRSRAGHVYFDLIEPSDPGTPSTAKISVVLFAQTRQIVNAQLKRQNVGRLTDGMAVRIRAAVDFYAPQGRLQLRMTGIDPRYLLAAMAAERDALIARLHAEGVTKTNKERPVPMVPLRVGLVTSAISAAAGDFLTELDGSGFAFRVTAVDARVQGELAPFALIAGLRAMYREPVDVIALIRGGGSRGDLSVFDNERLARTIADAPVPVITGIGHEMDRSVCDEVAHTNLKTPTAVAAALTGMVGRYLEAIEQRWSGVRYVAESALATADDRITRDARRAARAGRDGLVVADLRLDARSERLPDLARRCLRDAEAALERCEIRRRASDPSVLLARGWSITRTSDGVLVRSTTVCAPDDTLVTRVADGTIISSVTMTDPDPTPAPTAPEEQIR